MEELAETLATSFQVSEFPNNPHASHPRFSQYKIKKTSSQAERRKQLLELQKLRRHNYLHHVRGLAEGNWCEQLSDEDVDVDELQKSEEKEEPSLEKEKLVDPTLLNNEEKEGEEPMELAAQQVSKRRSKLKNGKNASSLEKPKDALEEPMETALQQIIKPSKSYKNQLMLSEWLVDIPEDMAANWLLMLCPVGRRSLVITANGSTKAYTKSGYCVNRFPSYLPGGNRQQQIMSKDYTVLDTVYSETERTFYVLDLMCWRGHPVFNSETEFRFYWLNAKLEEVPEVKQHSSLNPYRFVALPHYLCSAAAMEMVMWSPLPFSLPLDGILFYNKETHYMHGPTPLVGWLKAYMLPELLGIKVPDNFMSERPANYTCMEQHVKKPQSKKKKNKKDQPMQTETEMVEKPVGEASVVENPKLPTKKRKGKKKKRGKKDQPMQISGDEPADSSMCAHEKVNGSVLTISAGKEGQCSLHTTEEMADVDQSNDISKDSQVHASVSKTMDGEV